MRLEVWSSLRMVNVPSNAGLDSALAKKITNILCHSFSCIRYGVVSCHILALFLWWHTLTGSTFMLCSSIWEEILLKLMECWHFSICSWLRQSFSSWLSCVPSWESLSLFLFFITSTWLEKEIQLTKGSEKMMKLISTKNK